MKIELVGAVPVKVVQPAPVHNRVSGAPNRGGQQQQRRGGSARGGGAGAARGGRQPKPVRTAADLDAELDAHNAKMQTE
jgi:hypothetical protein